jgi:foldase protein PrsA
MRRRLLLLFVPFALFGATACGEYFDPVAASVAGDEISFAEVEESLKDYRATATYKELAQQGDVDAIDRDFERGFIARAVRRLVLEPEAEKLGIEITDQDVENQIEIIKQDFPSEQAFQEALKEQGLEEPDFTSFVRDRLLEDSLRQEVTAEVVPGEEELRSFYEENIDRYRQAEVSHILVEEGARADRIAKELQSAPKKNVDGLFAQLARRHSQDQQSATQGGSLGFAAPDQFVPEFAEVVRSLGIGEISDPVQTDFGFHVIRVTGQRMLVFEEVRSQISTELAGPQQDKVWEQWVVDAYEAGDVHVNPRYGELDPETGLISPPAADDVPGAEEPPGSEGGDEELLPPGAPPGQ